MNVLLRWVTSSGRLRLGLAHYPLARGSMLVLWLGSSDRSLGWRLG